VVASGGELLSLSNLEICQAFQIDGRVAIERCEHADKRPIARSLSIGNEN
jgi:hypothetical protein